jgi:hypothetical protein
MAYVALGLWLICGLLGLWVQYSGRKKEKAA